MAKPRQIQSPQNPLLKQIVALRDARQRRKQNLVVIDGWRNIARAIQAGWNLTALLTEELSLSDSGMDAADQTRIQAYLNLASDRVDYAITSKELLAKVAYGQSSHPVALARPIETTWEMLQLSICAGNAIFMVLDRVEKPGNIGAAVRTCDALGVSALLLSDPICDLWNPNAIRASSGAIFSLPVMCGSFEDVYAFLERHDVQLFAARIENSTDYLQVNYPRKSAVVFGNEANGLQERWSRNAKAISIRMRGRGDSLNVSASAAIILSEITRQHDREEVAKDAH